MKNVPAYLRDVDVATRYGISRTTVWRWVGCEELPKPIKFSNGTTRWKISDLLDWELAQTSKREALETKNN